MKVIMLVGCLWVCWFTVEAQSISRVQLTDTWIGVHTEYDTDDFCPPTPGLPLLELNRLAEARSAFQDASFFVKAWGTEHTGNYQEDGFNPIYEEEIDEAVTKLKIQNR